LQRATAATTRLSRLPLARPTYECLSVSRLMGPVADEIASLMGPPDRQGHGATPQGGGPGFRQGHGASRLSFRQGHGATQSLTS
jgi:hypothetical protein